MRTLTEDLEEAAKSAEYVAEGATGKARKEELALAGRLRDHAKRLLMALETVGTPAESWNPDAARLLQRVNGGPVK